jgi:PhnB protein
MPSIDSYLNFPGNTEEAFNFYKSVFGGEFAGVQRFKDSPPQGGQLKGSDGDKIMHIALPIGKSSLLMGTDVLESQGHKLVAGNNFYLSINADSQEEADKIFNKLSEGGKVVLPMQNAFWGTYFGMVNDKFGIQWMMSFDPKKK